MASKFRLAGGIPERPVRPIWDAIDSRQFKKALKHSATLLSKYPISPYALTLKALILERMGKNDEALSVCLNAKEILCTNDSSIFIDDLTLSTLQIVFQRLDHFDMATSCYEYACGKYPNNLVPSIRYSVGRPAPATSLDLRDTTFNPKENIWTRFRPQGSKHTPPHQSCAFKWKDYCPLVFRTLRKLFKVDPADYLISICGDDVLRLLPSPGKSGSFLVLLLSISVWVRFFPWES